jgi:hypothetical protein
MVWHCIGKVTTMKVIQLKTNRSSDVTEHLILRILKLDINAFKATNKQFIRNNPAYFPVYPGMIA